LESNLDAFALEEKIAVVRQNDATAIAHHYVKLSLPHIQPFYFALATPVRGDAPITHLISGSPSSDIAVRNLS